MTFLEMHEQFDLLMDKHEQPYFETEEKDKFLNIALKEYVKTRYKAFEVNEKRREDLRPLIKTSSGTTATVNLAAITDFWLSLSLQTTITFTECGTTYSITSSVTPIQHDDYLKIKDDPFHKPTDRTPLYLDYSTYMTIFSDTVPTTWTLTYLKFPLVIDANATPGTSSDMPLHAQDEIIELAVRKAMVGTENPAYQAQLNEIQVME